MTLRKEEKHKEEKNKELLLSSKVKIGKHGYKKGNGSSRVVKVVSSIYLFLHKKEPTR